MKYSKEGHIEVPGGRVWYGVAGEKTDKPTLIVIHGGPGFPHNYLTPIGEISDERQVVFYDQLGCGKSDRPKDKQLWVVDRFVDELDKIVKFLNLKTYHVLGQSWGAALGVCFALKKPSGLLSLVLANPYLSTSVWMRDAKKLLKQLPKETQRVIAGYKKGKFSKKEYSKKRLEFYEKYCWGFKNEDSPKPFNEARKGEGSEVYNYMWGPDEFLMDGTLKSFDVSNKLSSIGVPVLFVCGKYDEATPEATRYFKGLIRGAKMKVFEKSAHLPQLTETHKYIGTLRPFLKENDRQ